MRLSVVIPLHDEAESLPMLLDELAQVVDRNDLGPAEFLLVDDGSRDASWPIIRSLAESDERIRGIRFRRNFGKAAALTAGFLAAKGDVVFTMDADLQDDPAEIPRFLVKLDEGLDVVSGWKRIRHDPWHKVGPSRVFNALVSAMTGCHLHDHNCGFKAYRAEVVREVEVYGELHRFIPALAHARGFRTGEVVVNHRSRKFGRSHYGVSRFIKGLLDLLTVQFLSRFGRRPLHFFGGIGLALIALGAIGMIYLAVEWFFESIGRRPLLVYSATFLGVGTQLLCLGILGELIAKLNFRPRDTYSVAETLEPPAEGWAGPIEGVKPMGEDR